MAQRIVLSREQVRKLRELREGVGVAKDDETAEKKAANPQIQAPSIEETRSYEVLTGGSITNRIRRPWGFER
jgi:hypothetical protein